MKRTRHQRLPAAGFSLVELLVSMTIGLVLTLAITSVLKTSEGTKRSTTSVNDVNQSGAYAAYALDRVIRSAGSGYAQRWRELFGCPLVGSKGSVPLTWRSSAWPNAAYSAQRMVLAPVLIGKNQADTATETRGDLITVMSGTAGYAEAPQPVVSVLPVTPVQLNVASTVGYRVDDLVLLGDQSIAAGCMVEQVSAVSSAGALTLSGNYTSNSGTGAAAVNVSSFGTGSYVAQLGNANATNNNAPEFITYGVTDNTILSAYDLFEMNGPAPAQIGEGVVEMHALYGIDTTPNFTAKVAQWIDPAGSGYDIATLLSPGQQNTLRNIIAIRVGMILRTSLPEQAPVVQPQALTLFSDLPGLSRTRTLTGSDVNYRFRTVEMTVPLRNVTLAPP